MEINQIELGKIYLYCAQRSKRGLSIPPSRVRVRRLDGNRVYIVGIDGLLRGKATSVSINSLKKIDDESTKT